MNTKKQILVQQPTDQLEVKNWNQEQDDILIEMHNNKKSFEDMSTAIPGRSVGQCKRRLDELLGLK